MQARSLQKRGRQLIIDSLFEKFSGRKIAIMGVGNPSSGDDGCGNLIAEELEKANIAGCFSCGETPENYLGKIAAFKPRFILIVDAVNFGGSPGEIKYFQGGEIFRGLSTHTAGLDLTVKFLKEDTGAQVAVLGIQPKKIRGEMTPAVKNTTEKVVNQISEQLCTSR